MKNTQKELILNHLKRGRPITAIEALNKYHCFRLGARVWDLRQEGYNIEKKLIEIDVLGEPTKIAQYRLVKAA